MFRRIVLLGLVVAALALACRRSGTPTPTLAPTPAPSPTAVGAPSPAAGLTPSATPGVTPAVSGTPTKLPSYHDDTLGFARLGLIHLNDSKAPLGSRKDRHEQIGDGMLGDKPFRRIMADPRLAAVPKVLETPKGEDMVTNDRRALRKLRRFAARR